MALALSLLGPVPARAELLKNFKLGGQFDLQATGAANVTDFTTRREPTNGATTPAADRNDRIGDAQTRIMLFADWDLLDDVHSNVTLRKNDRNYGTNGGNGNLNTKSQAIVGNPSSGTGVLDNLFVDQAFVKIDKIAGEFDATLGRQFYGTSGDMIAYFGPSDKALYGLATASLDAGRVDWTTETLALTGVVGKITGHALGVAGVSDVDLRGLTATYKGIESVMLGIYMWDQVTHRIDADGVPPTLAAAGSTAGGKNDNLWIGGLKARALADFGFLGGELAKNYGDNRGLFTSDPSRASANNARYTGWAFRVDAGAKADLGVAAFAPWAHFGYGSGDGSLNGINHTFTAINPDYRPGSIYGRFAAGPVTLGANTPTANFASNGLGNRRIWGTGLKVTPADLSKLTIGGSWWDYSFSADPGPRLAGNKHIGAEADIDVTWAHSENVTLGVGVGEFFPGGAIKESIQSAGVATVGANSANSQRGVNAAELAYFDVRVKF